MSDPWSDGPSRSRAIRRAATVSQAGTAGARNAASRAGLAPGSVGAEALMAGAATLGGSDAAAAMDESLAESRDALTALAVNNRDAELGRLVGLDASERARLGLELGEEESYRDDRYRYDALARDAEQRAAELEIMRAAQKDQSSLARLVRAAMSKSMNAIDQLDTMTPNGPSGGFTMNQSQRRTILQSLLRMLSGGAQQQGNLNTMFEGLF